MIIVSKEDNLNKVHLKYLESKIYENAGLADRFSGGEPISMSLIDFVGASLI